MNYTDLRKRDEFISVIMIGTEMEEMGVTPSIRLLHTYLNSHFVDYEILVIEDLPNIFHNSKLDELLKEVSSTRVIELSYEIDYEVAVTVGMENSIGDYVFVFNTSQDPLEVIIPMVEICSKGDIDVVVGVAQNTKNSLGYSAVRPFASLVLNEIGYYVPKNATTLRCLSRAAVNSATKARNYHHQIFVRISQCGLGSYSFNYQIRNSKMNKKSLFKAMRLTLNLLVFNSTKPLRWMSSLGIFGSFFALAFASYSFFIRLINHNVADGWSSIVILMSILFMLLFIILSFFGEYLGRLLNDQSKHESYWIVNERHSSVMVDVNRYNVSDRSEGS